MSAITSRVIEVVAAQQTYSTLEGAKQPLACLTNENVTVLRCAPRGNNLSGSCVRQDRGVALNPVWLLLAEFCGAVHNPDTTLALLGSLLDITPVVQTL